MVELKGEKTFRISTLLKISEIFVNDLATSSLRTILYCFSKSLSNGNKAVLSLICLKTRPSSSAKANSTSLISDLISSMG